MKLVAVLCLAIMLVVSVNIVSVQAQDYGCHGTDCLKLQQALEQARANVSANQIKQQAEQMVELQNQHTQDSQIMILLISIIIGLSCGIIALIIIFLKNRTMNKPRN